jgi:hypothetical protein
VRVRTAHTSTRTFTVDVFVDTINMCQQIGIGSVGERNYQMTAMFDGHMIDMLHHGHDARDLYTHVLLIETTNPPCAYSAPHDLLRL